MNKEKIKLRGMFRIQITEEGKGVVGDSGWCENQVTNLGINQYLVNHLLGDTGSRKNVTHMALGTGAAPASTDTALAGELTAKSSARKTVSTSVVSSRTAQFVASFNSSDDFVGSAVTTSVNIANVGLFETSTTNAGTLFAGNTYASSSCASNQNVVVTYQIRFS